MGIFRSPEVPSPVRSSMYVCERVSPSKPACRRAAGVLLAGPALHTAVSHWSLAKDHMFDKSHVLFTQISRPGRPRGLDPG